jgi:hypothetical protein
MLLRLRIRLGRCNYVMIRLRLLRLELRRRRGPMQWHLGLLMIVLRMEASLCRCNRRSAHRSRSTATTVS